MSGTRRDLLRIAGGASLLGAAAGSPAQAQPAAGGALIPAGFGAVGDGRADDGPAFQRALDAAIAGDRPLLVPPGRYRIGQPLIMRVNRPFAHAGAFSAGPQVLGSGIGLTTFIADFAEGALFDLAPDSDPAARFRASLGAAIRGFTIVGGRGRATGIRLRAAFQCAIADVHIAGLGGDGIEIVCRNGDNDGSNMVSLERVRIENVRGWGIAAAAALGFNENSFLKLTHVFVQGCGTRRAGTPATGGMTWKGQVLTLEQCAFAVNENVALFIPGEAGLAQTADLRSVAFENNIGRHLLCTGVTALKGRNLQFYSNDQHVVTAGCEFDASSHPVRAVDLDGVVVRATAGNGAITAFRLHGPHAEPDTCRVRNVVWENYDHRGQRRFDGFVFDDVRQCCVLSVDSPTALLFGPDPTRPDGNTTPLRRRGGGGTPSMTGEWVAAALRSPLVLRNNGLAGPRRWFVYLFEESGARRLTAAADPPILDRDSGYRVRATDRAQLLVGEVATDAQGRFVAGDDAG